MTHLCRAVRASWVIDSSTATANLQLSNTGMAAAAIIGVMIPLHSCPRRFRTCTFRDPTGVAATASQDWV